MTDAARDRLINPLAALDHPATLVLLALAFAPLVIGPVFLKLARKRITTETRHDARRRARGWLWVVPAMAAPVLLGAAWVIVGVAALSALCFRDFTRVTGLFREKLICYAVLLGMAVIQFAALDNFPGLFAAAFPLTIACVAGFAAAQDRPKGYLQRVALGAVAFALFGSCLGHLSYLANDPNYRPKLALVLVAVGFWDVARYVVGKTVRGRQLAPNTTPDRTVAGSVAGAVVVLALVYGVGPLVFAGTPLENPLPLLALGALLAVAAQLGDLMLASIKRDTGVDTLDNVIPGHGGVLDRFDSMILVAPVAYHGISFFGGLNLEAGRVLTG
ncbi:phosphatidate cytidylyltransferase [Urbifossiella limnaea]|uniref:Phosphatidate cytidylyltransferase n=1 Tax=Urbifossiella limnaea TaxID=2528023 RepID=A0A517XTJ6_9BACT|nr:phosphatidate cytidylyltransferase [Urbifossiella limnaea]QDU20846.1 Phosphatidate cytidylyltransferase [Urbifossiella limnaea]